MFIIDQELCIQCGTCIRACCNHALEISDALIHNSDKCNWCGHCLAV